MTDNLSVFHGRKHHVKNKFIFGGGILISLLASGCDLSSDPTSPDRANTAESGFSLEAREPNGPESPEDLSAYPDISAEEASTPAPLEVLGMGPQRTMSVTSLEALRRSYIKRNNPMRVKKLELSYDFNTGAYKGGDESFRQADPLAKSAWWTTSYILQRSAVNGYWLPYVGNNQLSGENLKKIYGFNPQTQIEYGVTPSLSFRVGYNTGADYYNWTNYRKWNEAHSNGDTDEWITAFSAKTTYANYTVCYTGQWINIYEAEGQYTACNNEPLEIGARGAWFKALGLQIMKNY